jgi:hypothetical protein
VARAGSGPHTARSSSSCFGMMVTTGSIAVRGMPSPAGRSRCGPGCARRSLDCAGSPVKVRNALPRHPFAARADGAALRSSNRRVTQGSRADGTRAGVGAHDAPCVASWAIHGDVVVAVTDVPSVQVTASWRSWRNLVEETDVPRSSRRGRRIGSRRGPPARRGRDQPRRPSDRGRQTARGRVRTPRLALEPATAGWAASRSGRPSSRQEPPSLAGWRRGPRRSGEVG